MVQFSPLIVAAAAGTALPHLAQAVGLNTAAKAIGWEYFGSATDNPELDDAPYVAKLADTQDFGQITPGNAQKWETIEPTQGTFNFEDGDVIATLAEENGQLLRCHTLVWYSQLASWVENGSWTNETLIDVMTNHITNVVKHYKGQCYAWDVVNEAVDDDGTWRDDVFYNTIGPAYIPLAFEAAAAADPDVKLYYNDYNIEYSGAKATKALEIVKSVQDYGAKIDGVGLQGHLISGSSPSRDDLKKTMATYTDLGLEVAFTELDIRIELPTNEEKLAQQAVDYSEVTLACVETENCIGITIWDYTDKYSWVPDVFPGEGAALVWDEDLKKKPAYNAILSALGGSNSTAAATSKLFQRRSKRGALGQFN